MLVIFAVNSRSVCQLNTMRNCGDIAAISHRVVCVISINVVDGDVLNGDFCDRIQESTSGDEPLELEEFIKDQLRVKRTAPKGRNNLTAIWQYRLFCNKRYFPENNEIE